MGDAREHYFAAMRQEGRNFLASRRRMGPMRSELAGGMRVEAILPAECFYHLKDMHGVTLSDKDQVEWLKRNNPEVVPDYESGKIMVGGAVARRRPAAGEAFEVGPGRRTRFGRATFSKVYPNPSKAA